MQNQTVSTTTSNVVPSQGSSELGYNDYNVADTGDRGHTDVPAGHNRAVNGVPSTDHAYNTAPGRHIPAQGNVEPGYATGPTAEPGIDPYNQTGTVPQHTGARAGASTGSKIKGVASQVHGVGEALRGNFNAAVDTATGDRVGQAKNDAIAQRGHEEFSRGLLKQEGRTS